MPNTGILLVRIFRGVVLQDIADPYIEVCSHLTLLVLRYSVTKCICLHLLHKLVPNTGILLVRIFRGDVLQDITDPYIEVCSHLTLLVLRYSVTKSTCLHLLHKLAPNTGIVIRIFLGELPRRPCYACH